MISRAHFFLSLQNLLDRRYVGSAGNITDSLNTLTGAQNGAAARSNATGSIYAGAPRSVVGGLRVKF